VRAVASNRATAHHRYGTHRRSDVPSHRERTRYSFPVRKKSSTLGPIICQTRIEIQPSLAYRKSRGHLPHQLPPHGSFGQRCGWSGGRQEQAGDCELAVCKDPEFSNQAHSSLRNAPGLEAPESHRDRDRLR